ncbi:ABC transporter ATP-binding protein [Candidimonas sp. SYP-B2681]|uniref:ABC transporter ATP-binding protein n=1 Tax=Candidimonas sp. SYP-B2681 TaxID=2497686 RepID=UPI000F8944C4|nr:ABC transporter ATP-binding protein [Candidimonas sp. SYP-B2681]RTZ40637.1 ABC transporter ATP-binding protein [Candidimonas sp. SYP-B2681]
MTTPILNAKNIVKRYGKFQALSGVDLCVQAKTVHSVIGPNGAGKTTLFHTLTGTVPITAGSIVFNGLDVCHMPDHKRVQLGMARSFQVTSLFPSLTVGENLRLAAQGIQPRHALRFWALPRPQASQLEIIESILARLGLTHCIDKLSSELSHGQQRRLEVGMALAAKPKIIFLDEPTSGMGIDDIDAMKAIIHGLRQDLTVVLIEHNMGIVMDISDTITVMQLGTVLVEGPPAAVKADARVKQAYLGNMITGGA